jgi:hypothetical protein
MSTEVTLLGAMVTGMGAMSGALTVLWRRFEKLSNDCEADRRRLWQEITKLKGLSLDDGVNGQDNKD